MVLGVSALLIALPAMALLAPRPRLLRWVALLLAALVFGVSPLGEQVRGPQQAADLIGLERRRHGERGHRISGRSRRA